MYLKGNMLILQGKKQKTADNKFAAMEKMLEETMKALSTANGKNAGVNSMESGLSLESSKREVEFLGNTQNEDGADNSYY